MRVTVHAVLRGRVRTRWSARLTEDNGWLAVHRACELGQACDEWSFHPAGPGTEITLTRRFDPVETGGIQPAEAGAAALATLDRIAGQGITADELVFTFSDTITVDNRADAAYRFIHASDRWTEFLHRPRRRGRPGVPSS